MLKLRSYVRAYRYTYCDNVCKRMTGYGYKDYVDDKIFKVFIWRDPKTKIWHCADEDSGMTIKTFITYIDIVEFIASDKLYDWYRNAFSSKKYATNVKQFKQLSSKLEQKRKEKK